MVGVRVKVLTVFRARVLATILVLVGFNFVVGVQSGVRVSLRFGWD